MTDKTKIKRLPERSSDNRAIINSILDEGFICHAAYVTDGRPVVIPTLYARDKNRILLHGSNSMGIARGVREGSPLSVAVTHIDGLVIARSAFHSSANYRSVVIHGMGRLLEGMDRLDALDVIVDRLIPGRLVDLRTSTDAEVAQTSVVQLALDEMSAKIRTGDPADDPADLESDVWAGVVPMAVVAGKPEPAANLASGIEAPDYLTQYQR